ncbi:MAG: cytochrome c [Phycisphaerales bacterium]|nr:cytochrome c [Phycisphaerae bacterium]NNF42500.1 cytochrome c [Phycisphaerales bacterium]NNM25237.1 cytochrome c [Phycisphaerales bacterium]
MSPTSRIPRLVAAGVATGLLITALGVAACTQPATTDSIDEAFRHGRVTTPVPGVADVMVAKLSETQGLLGAIALEDFAAIERRARALRRLSQDAGWRVHTTVAYGVFSDEFGATAGELGDAAQSGEMDRVMRAYGELTKTCVACHRYMRTEGLYRDHSGAVSRLSPSPRVDANDRS